MTSKIVLIIIKGEDMEIKAGGCSSSNEVIEVLAASILELIGTDQNEKQIVS